MFLKYIALLIIIYCQRQIQTQEYDSETTLDVYDRIKFLKRELLKQIRENKEDTDDVVNPDRSIGDNYEYNSKNLPITPIMDSDKRQLIRGGRGVWPNQPMVNIKSSTTASTTVSRNFSVSPVKKHVKKKKNVLRNNAPAEIFYRRWEGMDKSKNTPLQYTHCLDLLTGYLMNSDDFCNKTSKVIGPTDTVVLRLLHLLSMDMRHDSQDEIYSILYQISNLKLRLFQWDDKAIRLLMNQIIHDKIHHFQSLKHGVKAMFVNWHLDLGNASNLLEQSRIFRPPCIQTSELSGSTKTSRADAADAAAYYAKANPTKKICTGLELEDDSCAY